MMILGDILLSDGAIITEYGLILIDSQYNIITVNSCAEILFEKFDFIGKDNIIEFVKHFTAAAPTESIKNLEEGLIYVRSGGEIKDLLFNGVIKNNKQNDLRFFAVSVKLIKENGNILMALKDVTEFQILKSRAKHNCRIAKSLSENILHGYSYNRIIISDNEYDLIFLDVNSKFEKITGLKSDYIVNKSFLKIYPDIAKKQFNSCIKALCKENTVKEVFTLLNKKIEITFVPIDSEYCILIYTALHDKMQLQANAFNAITRLKNFIDNASDGIFVMNSSSYFSDCNKVAQELTGYDRETLKTMSLFDITPAHQHNIVKDALQTLAEKNNCSIECQYIKKDNKIRFWNIDFVKISDREFITFNKDINEKILMQEKLQYNCYHDHLTGLYNRRFVTKFMLDYDKENGNYPISVIVADINGLKVVNDAFGRFAGDSLIKRTAEIIQHVCGKDDIIGKWGGDEFIIITPKSNHDKATSIISEIKKETEKDNNNIKLSVSTGYQIKYSKEENFDDIIRAAENMMLQNKIYEGASFRSQTISIILNTLHEKNRREEQHSVRVSRICIEIGKAMNLSQNEINRLKVIGLLHDIGKIGINENILNKDGKLTSEEFNEIKKHSEIGYRILSSSNQTSDIAQDVLDHHERFDGTGYPKGTPGYKLSTMAKTLTIADSYDAMTSERPYKSAMSKEEAINELKRCAAKQFDPYIVDVFINKVLNNPASEI